MHARLAPLSFLALIVTTVSAAEPPLSQPAKPPMIGFLHREAERYEAEWRLHWGYYSTLVKNGLQGSFVESRPIYSGSLRPGQLYEALRPFHAIVLTTTEEGVTEFTGRPGSGARPPAAIWSGTCARGADCCCCYRPCAIRTMRTSSSTTRCSRASACGCSTKDCSTRPTPSNRRRRWSSGRWSSSTPRNVREHPTTAGVRRLYLPRYGSQPAPGVEALGLDANWQVVVAGEATAKSYLLGDDNAHDAPPRRKPAGAPPIAAVRSFGRGRLFVYSVHAKHAFLNYGNRMWPQITESDGDRQSEKPSDGNRLLLECLALAERAGAERGGTGGPPTGAHQAGEVRAGGGLGQTFVREGPRRRARDPRSAQQLQRREGRRGRIRPSGAEGGPGVYRIQRSAGIAERRETGPAPCRLRGRRATATSTPVPESSSPIRSASAGPLGARAWCFPRPPSSATAGPIPPGTADAFWLPGATRPCAVSAPTRSSITARCGRRAPIRPTCGGSTACCRWSTMANGWWPTTSMNTCLACAICAVPRRRLHPHPCVGGSGASGPDLCERAARSGDRPGETQRPRGGRDQRRLRDPGAANSAMDGLQHADGTSLADDPRHSGYGCGSRWPPTPGCARCGCTTPISACCGASTPAGPAAWSANSSWCTTSSTTPCWR